MSASNVDTRDCWMYDVEEDSFTQKAKCLFVCLFVYLFEYHGLFYIHIVHP